MNNLDKLNKSIDILKSISAELDHIIPNEFIWKIKKHGVSGFLELLLEFIESELKREASIPSINSDNNMLYTNETYNSVKENIILTLAALKASNR